jgi:hypothetical protein
MGFAVINAFSAEFSMHVIMELRLAQRAEHEL